MEKIDFFSAILIISRNPERLVEFYRNIVGIPLEDEQHGETHKHYGCELGDLHFAIHPPENFSDKNLGAGSIKLAFTIFDIKSLVKRIEAAGHKVEYQPKDIGFSIMTAIYDPDGNYIEFTQLSDRWFKHLEDRKSKGIDVVQRWKTLGRETI
jgi:predicted enzyme related to lactoylglutathione lyase